MTRNFIAADIGATSGRVILGTYADGRISTECLHRFPNPILPLGGKYYWDIHALYSEIVRGLAEAGRRDLKIESVGIDTWGVDFVCVADDGSLLSLPRSYRDPYTDGEPERFFERIPRREVYERTGIQIMNFNTLYQLSAQRREGSSALRDAASVLFMPDALSYMLTDGKVCEYTILSTSQLLDPRSKEIDAGLLSAAGTDISLFPRIVMPGERVGVLRREIADATGLGAVPVIAVAGHDTASAVAAVPAENERFAYLSSGTWSLMGIELREPVIGDDSFAMNFTNEGGVDGTVRFLKNITGMWLLEQCRAEWSRNGRDYTYNDIMRMAESAPRSTATIDPDDPSFASPTDMAEAICAYCRSHGIDEPCDDAATARLIFDSLAAKYGEVLARLRKFAPFDIETLHVIGGGAQNDLLNRLTAEATGARVVAGPSEATALGNLMIQARAAGLVDSLADMRRCVRESSELKIYEPKKL